MPTCMNKIIHTGQTSAVFPSITNANADNTCRWCGMYHGPRCPSVKSIEFEGDGITVKRVEFFAPNNRWEC